MIDLEKDDVILIRDLDCSCIIGIFDEERTRRQIVRIQAEVYTDLHKAGESDDFNDALNYSAVESYLKDAAESSEFFLLEKLAAYLADNIRKKETYFQSCRAIHR